MLIDDLKTVVSTPFEEIVSTVLVLKLLSLTSKLLLNGGQPGGCSACLRDYHYQLKTKGMTLLEKYEAAKNRTCKPAWNGLKYIPATARHWNSELLSDKEATELLSSGNLKESDFLVLPLGFESEQKIQEKFEKRHAPAKRKK